MNAMVNNILTVTSHEDSSESSGEGEVGRPSHASGDGDKDAYGDGNAYGGGDACGYGERNVAVNCSCDSRVSSDYSDDDRAVSSDDIHNEFDSSENDSDDDLDIRKDLAELFKYINISQNDLTTVLSVLRRYHPDLPQDARTLLGCSPKPLLFRSVPPGEYYHFGLTNGILFVVEKLGITDNTLSLEFNVDGVPIYRSSTHSFWPVLCSIHNHAQSVFIVGVYYGKHKPIDPNCYLEDLINELATVMRFGVRGFAIKFRCCSCDTPARHFVLNVKSHGSYNGCERCVQRGVTIERRRVFLEVNSEKRDNYSFRNRKQQSHHKGHSPFEDINGIDMVEDFPIDYMHSVCRGVTYKLLEEMRHGKHHRLSVKLLGEMSDLLVVLRDDIVSEFSRLPRSIFQIGLWKATEFRLFLLYLAPIVLPKFCSSEFSLCFITLTCAMRIFCSPHNEEYLNYAERLIEKFLEQCMTLFGHYFFVYNIHSLRHISDDVRKFGLLDSFSCFKFENFLRFIKRVIRSPRKPLQQLTRRVLETNQTLGHCYSQIERNVGFAEQIQQNDEHSFSFGKEVKFYRKMIIGQDKCILQGNSANQYVHLKATSLKPFKISYFAHDQKAGSTFVVGWPMTVIGNVFQEPLASSKVGFVKVNRQNVLMKAIKFSDVVGKGMVLQGQYFISLLHTNFQGICESTKER